MTPAKIWRTHLTLLMQIFFSFLSIENGNASPPRVRCEKPDMIPNGSYRLRRNNMVMRITCNVGYQLQGYRLISCVRGKWSEEKPVCAKKGCKEVLKPPENGQIHVENDLKAILYCLDDYNLAGNRYTYCNGTHWDRPIGNCRAPKNVVQHSCDFETDDICGWVYEPRDGLEWKRVIAANVFTTFRTGPRHDHTTLTANGGHYMLMESLTRQNTPVILTSPIYEQSLSLKTSCCFQFYYFMYGAGVGSLFVILKPTSISLDEIINKRKNFIKFQKTGNQNNLWNEAHFSIEELTEDFQIVFVAKGGQGHLSDIAIDDVHLMTGDNCRALDRKADTVYSSEEYTSTTPYESIYDTQSCVGRCNDINNSTDPSMYLLNHLMGLCDCNIGCDETCCPDFKIVCLNEIFMESTTMESDETKLAETIEPETSVFWKSTPRPVISSTIKGPVNPKNTSTTPQTEQSMDFTTPSKPINMISTTITTTATTTPRSTLKTTPTITTVTTSVRTPSTTTVVTTTASQSTTAKRKLTTFSTTRTSTIFTPKTSTTIATTRSTTTTQKTTTTSRKPTATTPRTSTITRKTTTVRTTTIPLIPTSSPATMKTTANLTNLINNTTEKPSIKSKTMIFIVDHDDLSNPDVIRRGTDLLYCTLAIVLIVILCIIMYRRCSDRAVAWSMIRFSRNNSGDEETSSIIGSFNQPHSESISRRCRKIGKTAKRKFHFTTSRLNSHKNDKALGVLYIGMTFVSQRSLSCMMVVTAPQLVGSKVPD
uniref:Sushi domain-containing protein n=1 Tax=Glossina brevipalpis TaxID=37001 RepID=A0A1A9WXT4_9MUSC